MESGDVIEPAAPSLAVPSRRWCMAALSESESSYSETGQRPGVVTARQSGRWSVGVTGGLGEGLAVAAVTGGRTPRVAYLPSSDTDLRYRGSFGIAIPAGCVRGMASVANAWRYHSCVVPRDQRMVSVVGNATQQTRVAVRTPDGVWSSTTAVGTSGSTPVCWYDRDADELMVWPRPDKSILSSKAGNAAFRQSIPQPLPGLTWASSVVRGAAAWSPSGIIAIYGDGGDLYHLCSFDGGNTWAEVNASTADTPSTFGTLGGVIALDGGGFYVWWSTGVTIAGRYIPTADTPLLGSTGTSTGALDVGGVVQLADGRLLAVSGNTSATSWRTSTDLGRTWEPAPGSSQSRPPLSGGATLAQMHAQYVGASVVSMYAVTGSTGLNRAIMCATLGGWSTVEVAAASNAIYASGMQPGLSSQVAGRGWHCVTLPDSGQGWTAGGSGTGTLGTTGLVLTTTANDKTYTYNDANGAAVIAFGSFSVASGSLTAMRVTKIVSGGGSLRQVQVNCTTTSLTLFDGVAAATLGTVTIDTTAGVDVIIYIAQGGGVCCFARVRGEQAWQTVADGTAAATATGVTTDAYAFGSVGVGSTGVMTYHMAWWSGGDHALASGLGGTSYSALVYGVASGGGVSIPELADTDSRVPWLRQVSGPASVADIVDVACEAERGVLRADPLQWPSRSVGWRSADTSEQIIAFDLGAEIAKSNKRLGLLIVGANFRNAVAEWKADTGGWSTLASLDLAHVSGSATFATDDSLTIAAGYAPQGLCVGGTVVDATGAAEIVTQEACAPGTPMYIVLAPGHSVVGPTVAVCVRDGVAWEESDAVDTPMRYVRIRIPAAQQTVGGYYEAAVMAIVESRPLPGEATWGETVSVVPQVEVSSLPSGDQAQVVTGRARRRLTVGWQDGAAVSEAYAGSTWGADGQAVALRDDLTHTLADYAREAVGAPVLLSRLAPSNDRTRWIDREWVYGWWDGVTSWTYPTGLPGESDETARVDPVSVVEA